MCEYCGKYTCPPRCPNAPEPAKVHVCRACMGAITEGENYYEYDGDYYHEECFRDCAVDILLDNGATYGIAEEDWED